MKITYMAAASQDGFIAREDGDVSWLDELNIDTSETDLEQFFASVDGLVMGRRTYDFVFHYGSWPYGDKPTWICTRKEIKALDGANLLVVSDIDDVIRQAATRKIEHLWLVGGGQLASAFLAKNLITHLSISEMPIQLNRGIPLFSDHDLNDIACEDRQVIDKGRFKQIEITISHQHPTR